MRRTQPRTRPIRVDRPERIEARPPREIDLLASTGTDESIAGELETLRDEIDAIDQEILDRLNRRARCVQRVGELKDGGRRGPIYVAARERDLVHNLMESNEGPFPNAGIPHVFREIISATRSLEERVRVAFLGPEGTFSHQAASRQFGAQVDLVPATTLRDVFTLTERGDTHFGVIPVENTIEGPVTVTFDALVDSEVTICSEIKLEIAQHLMSRTGRVEDIQRVASHPQPLAQCRNWLAENLRGIETVQTTSTAAAAQLAVADEKVAAIGSEVIADVYDLLTIASNIEDHRGNTTRFLVIGRETPAPSGQDLTSAVFTVRRDQSGALHDLLGPFADHGVNLTAVQSRPMKGKPWEYIFIVDLEGHQDPTPAVDSRASGRGRRGVAASHKVLGSFPRALEVSSGIASSPVPQEHRFDEPRSTLDQSAHIRDLAPYKPGKPIEELERELGISGFGQARIERESAGSESEGRRGDPAMAAGDIHRYPDGASFGLRAAPGGAPRCRREPAGLRDRRRRDPRADREDLTIEPGARGRLPDGRPSRCTRS